MDAEAILNAVPFVDYLGIEIVEAADGYAEARLPLRAEHSTNPAGEIAHGGVTYSLADTVGGAATLSLVESVPPTVDMRIDYLAPATDDLRAEGSVVRSGESTAVVNAEVYDTDDHHVASARGVYKTDGQGEETPWTAGVEIGPDGVEGHGPDGDSDADQ
ncbi:MAG: PaaI family thioesterase [Haloarculaceae archaeon]